MLAKYRLFSLGHRAQLSVCGDAALDQAVPFLGLDESGAGCAGIPLDIGVLGRYSRKLWEAPQKSQLVAGRSIYSPLFFPGLMPVTSKGRSDPTYLL